MDVWEVSPVAPVSNQTSLIMTALGEGGVEILSVSSFLRVQCLGSPLLSFQLFKQDSLGGYIMQQTGAVLNSVGPSGTWCLTCLCRCCDHGIPRPGHFLEVWYHLYLPWQRGGRKLNFSDSWDVTPCSQELSRQQFFAA